MFFHLGKLMSLVIYSSLQRHCPSLCICSDYIFFKRSVINLMKNMNLGKIRNQHLLIAPWEMTISRISKKHPQKSFVLGLDSTGRSNIDLIEILTKQESGCLI